MATTNNLRRSQKIKPKDPLLEKNRSINRPRKIGTSENDTDEAITNMSHNPSGENDSKKTLVKQKKATNNEFKKNHGTAQEKHQTKNNFASYFKRFLYENYLKQKEANNSI